MAKNDDNRRIILARRARFVAIALAGAGLGAGADGCGGGAGSPLVCLEPLPPPEVVVPGVDAGSAELETTDAAPPPRSGPGVEEPPDEPPDIGPRICLSEL